MIFPLLLSQFLSSIVIICLVLNNATKSCLLAYSPGLNWVSSDVLGCNHNISFFIFKVLDDIDSIGHMWEGWLVVLWWNLSWRKKLLMTSCSDCLVILLSCCNCAGLIVRFTNSVVGWLAEENTVYATLSNIFCCDIFRGSYHVVILVLAS